MNKTRTIFEGIVVALICTSIVYLLIYTSTFVSQKELRDVTQKIDNQNKDMQEIIRALGEAGVLEQGKDGVMINKVVRVKDIPQPTATTTQ